MKDVMLELQMTLQSYFSYLYQLSRYLEIFLLIFQLVKSQKVGTGQNPGTNCPAVDFSCGINMCMDPVSGCPYCCSGGMYGQELVMKSCYPLCLKNIMKYSVNWCYLS